MDKSSSPSCSVDDSWPSDISNSPNSPKRHNDFDDTAYDESSHLNKKKRTTSGDSSASSEDEETAHELALNLINVNPKKIKQILYRNLEGRCILAEYKSQGCLCRNFQQKMVDILINASSLEVLNSRNNQIYLRILAQCIIQLMPNEALSTYFVKPYRDESRSKNAKGKLPDKWRNLCHTLKQKGVISRNKPSSNFATGTLPKSKNSRRGGKRQKIARPT